jgi:hypothetical protein
MRQITITAPQGSAAEVARIAFAVGVSQVSVTEKRILAPSGSETIKELYRAGGGLLLPRRSWMNVV